MCVTVQRVARRLEHVNREIIDARSWRHSVVEYLGRIRVAYMSRT